MAARLDPFWRFWADVDKTNGCWLWKRHSVRRPQFFFLGKNRTIARVAYYLIHGEWPQFTLRSCGEGRCVKPAHLKSMSKGAVNTEHGNLGKYAGMKMPPKKACHRGHPMSGENLHTTPRGTRHCWICFRKRQRESNVNYRAKRRILGLPINWGKRRKRDRGNQESHSHTIQAKVGREHKPCS